MAVWFQVAYVDPVGKRLAQDDLIPYGLSEAEWTRHTIHTVSPDGVAFAELAVQSSLTVLASYYVDDATLMPVLPG